MSSIFLSRVLIASATFFLKLLKSVRLSAVLSIEKEVPDDVKALTAIAPSPVEVEAGIVPVLEEVVSPWARM